MVSLILAAALHVFPIRPAGPIHAPVPVIIIRPAGPIHAPVIARRN